MSEIYLNHPNFGLLYKVCQVEDNQDLFTTLYAQRLFFLVTYSHNSFKFEPIGRSDARMMVEVRLRLLRRMGEAQEFKALQVIHQRTFQ